MTNHSAIKYPSTGQFRNATKLLRGKGKIAYQGTVKLHGTNGNLVMFEDGKIYCQSKERMLAEGCDNAGFWAAMQDVDLHELFAKVKVGFYEANGFEATYPIIISGEWAGGNIQKGVAINGLEKFFCIFGVKVGEDWQPLDDYYNIQDNASNIYNALQFPTYVVEVDFNQPELVQNTLVEVTEAVEAECPVGKFFGKSGVGEGVVWKPIDRDLVANTETWFKVKGEKHSVSKVKTLAAVDPEKLASMEAFVKYACTEARMEQGIQEVGLDFALIGPFLGWLNRDIIKEESDVLAASGLTMNVVGRHISNAAKQFYLGKLKNGQ